MRKIITATIAAFTLLFTSITGIEAAKAFQAPYEGQTLNYIVGDTVMLDFGCGEQNIWDVYFDRGQLPDGLTLSSQGMMEGTVTTPGTYVLGYYWCKWGTSGTGIMDYEVTIKVSPVPTPSPKLVAHSLADHTCSIYVGYVFPEVTDAGSVNLQITDGQGNFVRLYAPPQDQLVAGHLYGGAISATQLRESTYLFDLPVTASDTRPFECGTVVSISLSWQYLGRPAATEIVSDVMVGKPVVLGELPKQRLYSLDNSSCDFRIVAFLPQERLPGSTQIRIFKSTDNENDEVVLTVEDDLPNGVIDYVLNPESLGFFNISLQGVSNVTYNMQTAFDCGMNYYVDVSYRDTRNNLRSSLADDSNLTSVTPTRGSLSEEFTISATQVEGVCNIRVITRTPDEARPIAIAIKDVDADPNSNMNYITAVIIDTPSSDDGIITANLSLASKDSITASVPVPETNKIFTGALECSGTYLAVIDSPEGTLAATMITLGKLMPTCNAGSTKDEINFRCLPVERGFYTTELNSTTPIACPKGMTTATTASKSINDCYKPIAQTIAGLKAPKAMKFKATTNLALTTNTKALAQYKVIGPCTAKVANITTKVKGKKITTKMLKVTASKKAGLCSVTLTSEAKDKYLALSKVVKIKVSKSGK